MFVTALDFFFAFPFNKVYLLLLVVCPRNGNDKTIHCRRGRRRRRHCLIQRRRLWNNVHTYFSVSFAEKPCITTSSSAIVYVERLLRDV